jgi:hypothetical protein
LILGDCLEKMKGFADESLDGGMIYRIKRIGEVDVWWY